MINIPKNSLIVDCRLHAILIGQDAPGCSLAKMYLLLNFIIISKASFGINHKLLYVDCHSGQMLGAFCILLIIGCLKKNRYSNI